MASSSWGAPTLKTEAFDVPLSHNKWRAGWREDHCLIRTLKYTHMLSFSHKVKEIWSYCGFRVGWIQRAWGLLPGKKHVWNVESTASCIEIIFSARLNIITGIDSVLQGSQTTADCSSLRAGCMVIFFLYGKQDDYQSHQSHGKTLRPSKSVQNNGEDTTLSWHNSAYITTQQLARGRGWLLAVLFASYKGLHPVAADSSGKQMMALSQKHRGSTQFTRLMWVTLRGLFAAWCCN